VVVGGVNIAASPQAEPVEPAGRHRPLEAPLHISKVAVADKDGKPTRVRFETRDGKKVRVAVKSGEAIDG
jgi:large subunit ribosomal protein L24